MYSSPRPQPYAPTPYAGPPAAATAPLGATVSLDAEVQLPAPSSSERDVLDSLAELYSIIVALEALERAFNRDSLSDAEYAELCSRLLKQYRSNLGDERVARAFGDLEEFKARWEIDCPRATERLRVGLPATTTDAALPSAAPPSTSTPSAPTHGTGPPAAGNSAAGASAQTAIVATENFITFLDALRLGIGSKDQLHPLLSEVIQSANRATDADFESRGHIVKWLIRLNGMRAHEELSDGDRREIEFEIEAAYRGFKSVMSGGA